MTHGGAECCLGGTKDDKQARGNCKVSLGWAQSTYRTQMWGCLEQWLEERPEGQLTRTYRREMRQWRGGTEKENRGKERKREETSVERREKNKRRNKTETLKKPFKKFYFILFFTRGNKKEIPEKKEEEGCMANCESECLSVLMQMSLTLQ